MDQSVAKELWIREIRERAMSTVLMGFASTFVFYAVFRAKLTPQIYFDVLMAMITVLQALRTVFYTRGKSLPQKQWLFWHDLSIMTFSTLWSAVAFGIAFNSGSNPAGVAAIAVLLSMGYVANAAQFFCYRPFVYFYYVGCVCIPTCWMAVRFGTNALESGVLAVAPISFALLQGRARRSLWRAMSSLGSIHSDLKEAMDSIPGGLSLIRDNQYHRVNHFAAKLMGSTTAEVIGKPLGFTGHEGEFESAIREFQKTTKMVDCFEQRIETDDGVREHFVVLRRSARNTHHIYVACMDIDALAQAQRELDLERQRATQVAQSAFNLAGEIQIPLIALTEQVLVRQTPDLEAAREHLKRIQLAVSRMKSAS